MAAKYYKRFEQALLDVEVCLNTGNSMSEAVSDVISDRKFALWDDEDGDMALPVQRLDETIGDVRDLIMALRESLDILTKARKSMKDAK